MLTAFHKHKATVVNSNGSSHTGIFSMDDYKKANGSMKTLFFLKIHIRMMNWQNTKETNAVTSTAVGVLMIPDRCGVVISVRHAELVFAMSALHTRERGEHCSCSLITTINSTWTKLNRYYNFYLYSAFF